MFAVVLLGSCGSRVEDGNDLVLNSPEFYELFGYGDEGFKKHFHSISVYSGQKNILKTKKGKPFSGNVLINRYETGVLKSKLSFENGWLNGFVERNYKNGQIKQKIQFKNGILHGSLTNFRKDGSIKNEMTFIDGKRKLP